MSYIYLLWAHDEYGPVDLVATQDREKVIDLAKQHECGGTEEIDALVGLLDQEDDWLAENGGENLGGPGGHKLGNGWGGLHFQVVRLR